MVRRLLDSESSPDSLDLPSHSGISELGVRLLGLRAAQAYYQTLPTSDGLMACADRILTDKNIDLLTIRAAARCIPQRGALLVTANHPTGILDGVVLLAALLSRRRDVRIVANEAVCCIPVLADRVIPIQKTSSGNSRNRNAMTAIRSAWKRGECVIAFPAGTVAHWQWRGMHVADAPWNTSIQRFAARRGVLECRARLTIRNPFWFHAFAAISRKARTALLLRAFFENYGKLPVQPITFDLLEPSDLIRKI